ncbi:hypothetical protein QYE76_056009 [Lolium multiflorum]|jgi:hypothetical protein|uniref:Uncharacterized protein n=1 Tax=Lolium multiflorum TaxID=4521 RepID=A0AAD8T1N2_LOLMU|nr:uncharacterized protein LOC127338641 [Lolium perenne]KAK1667850.1 hypothetical protein QYE76_056009 [Lolium multiflorum]
MGNCNCFKSQRAAASWVDDDEWVVDVEEEGNSAAAEKVDQRVEVKIRVTKRQVQELLQKAGLDGMGAWTEQVLAELINSGTVCCDQPEARGHWRPSLQSISEGEEAHFS